MLVEAVTVCVLYKWACLYIVTSVGKPVNGLAGWRLGLSVVWSCMKEERRAL